MRHRFRFALLVAAALTLPGLPAAAQDLSGIQFNDVSGDYACKGGDAPEGVYRVKVDGSTLTFTKVKDDECPGRVAALTPKPFTVK